MMPSRSLSRIGLNVLFDAALAALAVPAARWLVDPQGALLSPAWWLPLGAGSLLLAGTPLRLPKQYWRFAGIGDLVSVAAGSAAGAAIFALALLGAGQALPTASFPAVHALTLLVLLGTPRVAYRLTRAPGSFRMSSADAAAEIQTVLLVGGGDGVDLFLRALGQERRPSIRVIGLLSLSARQTGRRIRGCPILGTADELGRVLDSLRAAGQAPSMLAVTAPDLAGPALSRLLAEADRQGLQVRLAPRPTSLRPAAAHGRAVAPALELKPVAIEDLLNRPQVPLDREGMARLIQGQCVLVTGAGGTIGSELARQVATLGPDRLILLDNGEYALWQIDLELAETHPGVRREAVIADIRDEARVRAVMEAARPDLVFHAAALKHVPMVESNPLEGLLTNAVGTRHVADAARAAGARAMVLISTDKAVNPTSVMGASKRLAEMYCQALDRAAQGTPDGAPGAMRCVTVRFGNVLGSTGSVVPLFRRQLERGGPLTVTHPDMQRYFMTVREAVGLVLQATVVGIAEPADAAFAERGGIFVLDMGEPVKIVELARQLIRLAGLRPDADVEIRFTGLRPGEKLYEELFHGKEPPVPTPYPGLLMAAPRVADPAIMARAIQEVAASCRSGETTLALATLARLVPEFEHNQAAASGTARS